VLEYVAGQRERVVKKLEANGSRTGEEKPVVPQLSLKTLYLSRKSEGSTLHLQCSFFPQLAQVVLVERSIIDVASCCFEVARSCPRAGVDAPAFRSWIMDPRGVGGQKVGPRNHAVLGHGTFPLMPAFCGGGSSAARRCAGVHHLFGQAWIQVPRTAPADFAFICPRPLVAAKSLLHLATQAAFLFSMPLWAVAGVFTASIEVAATTAATAMISFIADALLLSGVD